MTKDEYIKEFPPATERERTLMAMAMADLGSQICKHLPELHKDIADINRELLRHRGLFVLDKEKTDEQMDVYMGAIKNYDVPSIDEE